MYQSLRLTVITTIKEFESLRDAWNGLLYNSISNVIHLTHEWFKSWWETFHQTNDLRIITISDHDNQLIAIAPLMVTDSSYRGIHIKKICFMANGHSPFANFIIKEDRIAESIKAIFSYLETFQGWNMIEFRKLNSSDPTFESILDYLKQSRCLYGFKKNIETPFIVIDSDWETFLRQRSPKFRKVLRNKINRGNKTGDLLIERIEIAGSKDDVLQEMLEVSNNSWKRQIGTDLATNSDSKCFYMKLCDFLGPQGIITLWLLRKGGKAIAFEFHLTYNDTVYPIRADYDESFKSLSPGSILEFNILKALFEEGKVTEYNSCGHTYDYLLNWTDNTRKHYDIEIFSRHFLPHSLHTLEYRILPVLKKLKINKAMHYLKSKKE